MKEEDVEIGMDVMICNSNKHNGFNCIVKGYEGEKGLYKLSNKASEVIYKKSAEEFDPLYDLESFDKPYMNKPTEHEIIQQQLDALQKELQQFRKDLQQNTAELINLGILMKNFENIQSSIK